MERPDERLPEWLATGEAAARRLQNVSQELDDLLDALRTEILRAIARFN